MALAERSMEYLGAHTKSGTDVVYSRLLAGRSPSRARFGVYSSSLVTEVEVRPGSITITASETTIFTVTNTIITTNKGIVPSSDNSLDIGSSSSQFWRRGYINTVQLGKIWAGGTVTGWSNVFEVLTTGDLSLAILGLGSNNLYGWQLGEQADHRGTLYLRRRSTSSVMPGTLIMDAQNGTPYYLWVDTTGDLRIHTADPQNSDTSVGTVVGTQT